MNFLRHIFVAPFAIFMLIPLIFFDICISLYQRIAFKICKMKRVNRAPHFKIDPHRIALLSKMQRVYAVYIFYAEGVMNYAKKIIQESADYWCKQRQIKGRQHMAIDKSKMGVKELQSYQQSLKQKPKKSRKK